MYKGKREKKKPTKTPSDIGGILVTGLVNFLGRLIIELIKKYL